MVSGLATRMLCSGYVPAPIETVSPGAAAATAAVIVVYGAAHGADVERRGLGGARRPAGLH